MTPGVQGAAPAWRATLQRIWRWWSTELLAMLPERLSSFAGAARVPLLMLEEGAVTLVEPRPGEGQPEMRVELGDLDAPRAAAAVRALLERAGEVRGRARLALPPGESLVRRVKMPAATEENLGTVLGFEMDRLSPFRADEVYYDHRVIGRDSASGSLAVLLAVARRDVVEARLARARALGVSVQGVAVREDTVRAGPTFDVLPSAQRGERDRPRERLAKRALAGTAAVLLLAVLLVPALRKRAEVHAIKPALDRSYAEAQATDALIREVERHVADYNFLLERKHGAYPSLAYIEEVTRLLPDNTWLQQLELKTVGKGRELLISGETVSSSRLIEILEQSKLLQNATPRGTVTRGTQPGTERFAIAAEVRPRPQPEAAAVTETQTPLAMAPPYAPPQAAPAPVASTASAAPPPAAPPQAAKVATPPVAQKAPGR